MKYNYLIIIICCLINSCGIKRPLEAPDIEIESTNDQVLIVE